MRACPRAEAEKYSDETGEGSAVFGGLVQLIASALKYSVQTQCTTCIRCASLVARARDMDAVLEDCLPALKHLPKFFTPKLALAYTPSFLNSLLLLLCRLHPTPPPLLDAVRALVQPPASAAGSKADTAEEEREWDNLIFSCFSELCANCNEADLSSFFSITIFFFPRYFTGLMLQSLRQVQGTLPDSHLLLAHHCDHFAHVPIRGYHSNDRFRLFRQGNFRWMGRRAKMVN